MVDTGGTKYKKKAKERREQQRADESLEQSVRAWLDYGHADERHVGLTQDQLDARLGRIAVATTFEEADDLILAATTLIGVNEQKINHWYENTEDDSLSLWIHVPEGISVRGRERGTRRDWHQHQTPMPPRPGPVDVDVDELEYVNAYFHRDAWTGAPKGLITCYPSKTKA